MQGELQVRRRRPRPTPMSTRRLAFDAGHGPAPDAFPGFTRSDEGPDRRSRLVSGGLALLIHGTAFLAIVAWAWMNPAVVEEVIPVQLLKEEPPKPKPKPPPVVKAEPKPAPPVAKAEPRPAPPAPKPEPRAEPTPAPVPKPDPAPAPKALAERRSPRFDPQAQAVQPQVVNPSVVAKAAPVVNAPKLDMKSVGTAVAPREIAHPTSVASVSPLPSIAPAQPTKIDLGGAAAPALRGPIDKPAPAGPSAGPRQVVTSGDTVGTGSSLGDPGASSVREGILSNRDVQGSPTGQPIASINTRVGDGLMRGDGGTGAGQAGGGGGGPDCFQRSEVQAYQEQIRTRMLSRWALPAGVESNQTVKLRFKLDAAGSVLSAQIVSSGDPRLGQSALDALRSASPFPPMSDRVRCLAGTEYVGTFRNAATTN